ncbi:MAG: DNA recombination protein RmuC [Dehalococcoidia bacterium]|nr:DNA recombination protein RmuC [Dehalococcoidia bacterium]
MDSFSDIFPVIAVALLLIVLIVQLIMLSRRNKGAVDESRLRHETDNIKDALRRETDNIKDVLNDGLARVQRGLGEMQGLAKNVGDLKSALTNVKSRGTYGEIQLERLLDEVFPSDLYEKNFAIRGTAERVEFALRLPGKNDETVYLPIDSKFPIEDYERLQNAYDAGSKDAITDAQKGIEVFIKKSAKDIQEKYIEPPKTTDFGLLFLPTEGLYAEVLRIPGLVENVQTKYHVTLAGPTNLLALLNALQMGFKTLAIEKKSGEVWQILSAVKTEFETYKGKLEEAQKKIVQASDDISRLVGTRTNQIMRKLKKVESFQDQAQAAAILEIDESDIAD